MEKLVSLKEVAELLGVHPCTLREWDKNGKLEAIKTPGGHRKYQLSTIESLLKIKKD